MIQGQLCKVETARSRCPVPGLMVLALVACGCDHPKAANKACAVVDAGTPAKAQTKPGDIDLFAFVGPPADCVTCVRDNCGAAINTCANNQRCINGVICTLAKCASSSLLRGTSFGANDIGCVTGCFENDLSAALQVMGIATCVTQLCGKICGEVMPAPGPQNTLDAGHSPGQSSDAGVDTETVALPEDAAGDTEYDGADHDGGSMQAGDNSGEPL